ncbi:hypothetical protein SGLAM104S_02131 [Streptomyces glaucescens]
MTTILVTGGTGTLGRLVTRRLRADGHEVRVLSRHAQPYAVDLRAGGSGLDAAVAGVDTVGTARAVRAAGTSRQGRPSDRGGRGRRLGARDAHAGILPTGGCRAAGGRGCSLSIRKGS